MERFVNYICCGGISGLGLGGNRNYLECLENLGYIECVLEKWGFGILWLWKGG